MRAFLTLLLFSLTLQAQVIPSARRIATPTAVASGSSSLNTSLIAYWKLDEASGTRVDSEPTGTAQDLTDNATVTSNTGVLNNAGQFTAANTEYLSRTDSADTSTGDIDFSYSMWIYLDNTNAFYAGVSKYTSTGNQREYLIRYNKTNDRFQFSITSSGTSGTANSVDATTLGVPAASTWYFIVASHDSAGNLLKISVNNGTVNTVAHSTGVFDGTAVFTLGRNSLEGTTHDGRIDEVGFWKKVLSASEITALYGGGTPPACCPFTVIP